MSATLKELRNWYGDGMMKTKLYMLIICDTFSHEDHPEYFDDRESAVKRANNLGPMERLMESYDLRGDIDEQLNANVANCL